MAVFEGSGGFTTGFFSVIGVDTFNKGGGGGGSFATFATFAYSKK